MSEVYRINVSDSSTSSSSSSFDHAKTSYRCCKKRVLHSNKDEKCSIYKIGVSIVASILIVLGIVALIVLGALGKLTSSSPIKVNNITFDSFNIQVASAQACGFTSASAKASRLIKAISNQSSQSQARIIGGVTAAKHAIPWIVSLRLRQFGQISGHYCAGSIITNEHVLTAAHCVVGKSPADIIVLAGLYDLYSFSQSSVFYVQSIVIHQEYTEGVVNDIAILQLARVLTFSDKVAPICLTPDDSNVFGSELIVAGWGKISNGYSTVLPRYLQETELTVLNGQRICAAMSPVWNRDRMLCALDTKSGQASNACLGDSGGGLVGQLNGAWYLYGVVSYVIVRDNIQNSALSRCISNRPSYFTRVTVYYNWISRNI